MNPKLLTLLTSLAVLGIRNCLTQNNDHYQTCIQPFQCGMLNESSYPFYGGTRPVSCGYPGFGLTCQPDQDPLLTIASITYRVLEVNNSTRTLRVSRTDLVNNLCPTSPPNTALNLTLFDFYRPANDQNITLYYGCPFFQPLPAVVAASFMFNCSGFNPNILNFFLTSEASEQLNDVGSFCNSRINVPVSQDSARDLANPMFASVDALRASLESGFWIQYMVDNQGCDDCVRSGGLCGFNQSTTSFACHCTNGTFESTCSDRETVRGDGSDGALEISGYFIKHCTDR